MKFELRKDRKDNHVFLLYDKNDDRLFVVGKRDIFIYKSNWKSVCIDNIYVCKFDYKGIEKALNGRHGLKNEDKFEVKRILVIQMQ